jgi:putative transposase
MKYDSSKHHRQSIRLKGYDYSADGMYFITICAYQRNCLFGVIDNGVMHHNEYGQILTEEWLKSAEIRQEIELGEWVVMPNHIHGIVIIDRPKPVNFVGAQGLAPLQDVSPRPISSQDFLSRPTSLQDVTPRPISPQNLSLRPTSPQDAPPRPTSSQNALTQSTSSCQGVASRKPKSLSTFIAGFKMAVTKKINVARNAPGTPVWQRNYYEHIIRSEEAFQIVLKYIRDNPKTWDSDRLHPDILSKW